MSIEIVRYTGKTVTPLTDAILFEKAIPINGIYNGCALSHLGSNQVAITSGNGIIKGRDFKVTAETKLVQLASSGTKPGRIYVRINLSDSVNTIQLLSVCASPLPALVQDANFNLTNGIWEMELATYSATTTAISGLTKTYSTIKKSLTENNIINTNTATEEGTVADARQLNPNESGSLAQKVSNVGSQTLLVTTTATAPTLYTVQSLSSFREVQIELVSTTGQIYVATRISSTRFTTQNALNKSVYAFQGTSIASQMYYASDTTVYMLVTGGYVAKLYGIS